ncbi:MAG: carbohydrate porin [Gallionella sp.]
MKIRSIMLAFILGMSCLGAGAVENQGSPVSDSEPIVAPPDYSDTLLGDWGGRRAAMSAHGYDWEIVYKLDLLSKTSAPNQTGCTGYTAARCYKYYGLDNLDIKLSLDGEKIAGLKGSSALLYILSNHGSKPAVLGDRLPHGLDNIEVPENANTIKLYQAWIQQTFLDGALSVLAGLYDLNSEFYATESSSMFIQPTFGIGAEMAGTGQNGPSVFPTASFAIRAKAQTASGFYLQAVTLDGVPGDPNNHHGTHVQFNKGDGALNVIEAAVPLSVAENAHDNKLALGVWRYTARFDDLIEADINGIPVRKISHGYYAMMEKVLLYKPGGNEESISSFVRAGKADGDTSQFDMAWSAGMMFSAPFAGRDQDQLGFAIAQERNGAKYRAVPGSSPVIHERSFELSYRYQAMPGLVLQPIAQYLFYHSYDPAQDKSWWLGMRFETSF